MYRLSRLKEYASLPETEKKRMTLMNLIRKGITKIPQNYFQDYPNLTHLDLRYNQLTSLNGSGIEKLSNLKSLRLVDNQLTSFNGNGIEKLSNLRSLNACRFPFSNGETKS
eukprot:TRINITY_DN5066_c0_g1_i6.p1 TRINITY_DN5066_c0_g1~~TRINITY_DN5066_c0_g1_i6.p1  ORF type:complete len:111 (-),score=18.48 TRINITY_DN5066_c0_g1_i6:286-618(-)